MRAPENFFAVIMAGGGGTRLWPLSRQAHPKQMLALTDDRSLFQIAIDRLRAYLPAEQIYVVTVSSQFENLSALAEEIPPQNYLLEPAPRGTASAIGLAAAVLHKRFGDAVLANLTADHLIRNETLFIELLHAAYPVASKGEIVTLGIEPSHAATGYGYLQRGDLVERSGGHDVREVLSFREKPNHATAQAYLQEGGYSWNSGMFVWSVERVIKEMSIHLPGLYGSLLQIEAAVDRPDYMAVLAEQWDGLEVETIDYGVMERAERVLMIPVDDLGWNDIGGWDGVHDILPKDPDGNVPGAEVMLALDSKGNLVVQAPGQEAARLVVLLGMEDYVVIDTADALLVMPRSKSQDLKNVLVHLSHKGLERYL